MRGTFRHEDLCKALWDVAQACGFEGSEDRIADYQIVLDENPNRIAELLEEHAEDE